MEGERTLRDNDEQLAAGKRAADVAAAEAARAGIHTYIHIYIH
jgi:hypothetical protein